MSLDALRQALAAIPRAPILEGPTPVYGLPSLASELGLRALEVKCDGRAGGLFGGNKPRKLERLLGEALARGERRLWTVCTIGSHHGLSLALHARPRGFAVDLLQIPQPPTPYVRRLARAIASSGARTHLLPSKGALPVALLARRLGLLEAPGAYVPGGGSSALGALAYVEAALELAAQIEAGLLEVPDRIFVAVSTGGTFAGLWLGARLAGLPSEVVGVRVVDRVLANGPRLRALAAGAAGLLAGRGVPARALLRALAVPMRLVHGEVGRGYGWPTEAAERALRRVRAHGGPLLETTYTAKAFAALIAEATRRPGEKSLFWNTFNQLPFDTLVARTPFAHLPPAYRRALGGA